MKQYFKQIFLGRTSLISALVDLYLSSEENCCQSRFSTVLFCHGVYCFFFKLKGYKFFEMICLKYLSSNLYKILQLNSISGINLPLNFKLVLVIMNLHHGATIIRFESLIIAVILLSIISYNLSLCRVASH